MRYLSWWWIPFWIFTLGVESYGTRHHNARDNASLAVAVFLWLALNVIVTIVYLVTRAFRRASSDAGTRR